MQYQFQKYITREFSNYRSSKEDDIRDVAMIAASYGREFGAIALFNRAATIPNSPIVGAKVKCLNNLFEVHVGWYGDRIDILVMSNDEKVYNEVLYGVGHYLWSSPPLTDKETSHHPPPEIYFAATSGKGKLFQN